MEQGNLAQELEHYRQTYEVMRKRIDNLEKESDRLYGRLADERSRRLDAEERAGRVGRVRRFARLLALLIGAWLGERRGS